MPSIALSLFLIWCGVGLLAGLFLAARKTDRLHRVVENAWQEAMTLFQRRMERLSVLKQQARSLSALGLPLDDLISAIRNWEYAEDTEQQIALAQEISRQISVVAAKAEAFGLERAEETRPISDLITELQEQEPFLQNAREEYNAQAASWNTYRNGFPANLIASSRGWAVRPLFRPPDFHG